MIIVRIWEGLGNQLFQYAYARALQLRTGYQVCLDINRSYKSVLESRGTQREYMLDKFRIKLPVISNVAKYYFFLEQKNILQDILFGMSKAHIIVPGFYKEEYPSYKIRLKYVENNQYLMGWFQSEDYFKEYEDIIRKDLMPNKKIRISNKLRRLLVEEKTVAIHIRREDYKKSNNILPVYYYMNAKKYMESKIEQPYYIFFSDYMEWVRKEFDFGPNSFYISEEGLKDYEELLVMGKCKYNIIANSTFSWWGAWLNQNKNKLVIGPKQWVNHKSSNEYHILPNSWVKI